MPRAEFVPLCLAETQRTARGTRTCGGGSGLSLDWSLRYSTIDGRCQRTAQTSFVKLHEAGYLRRARTRSCGARRTAPRSPRPTSRTWSGPAGCTRSSSAGSAAEIIATTRPELLPACVALYRHPADPLRRARHGAGAAVRLRGAGAGRRGRRPGVRHRADDGVHVRRRRGRAQVAARRAAAAPGGHRTAASASWRARTPGCRSPRRVGDREGARRRRPAGAACRCGRWSGCTSGARPRWSSRSGRSGSSRCGRTPTGSGPGPPRSSGSRRSCGGGSRTGSTGSSGTGTSPGSGTTGCRSPSGSATAAARRCWPGSTTCRSTR